MRLIYFFLLALFAVTASAQISGQARNQADTIAIVPDPQYREDQIYAAIAYNMQQGKPQGYSQNSFSTNLTIGFLRDMPVNKARTYSVAAGLGYSYNNINHNLVVTGGDGERTYEVVPENSFDKNKLVLHYLEVPLELRWRNSDSISHKFWRVYLGFKVSYLFADKSQYTGSPESIKIKGNDDLNRFVYGTYLAVGWNTWNLYAYYGLNPLFKSAILPTNEKVKLNSVNLGLMFYIL